MSERQPSEVEHWGYFDDEAREFVLTTPRPPRHWKNILWNRRYNAQPTQSGAGISYRRDEDGEIVLLNWSGDKSFYVVDEETGLRFAIGYYPVCNDSLQSFSCRYGLGYQVITQECLDVRAEMEITVPTDGCFEQYHFELTDLTGRERRLRVTAYFDLDLNVRDPYHGTFNRFECHSDADGRFLWIRNTSYLADREWNACLASSRRAREFTFEKADFLGTYGNFARPEGLSGEIGTSVEPPEDPVIAACYRLTLPALGSNNLALAFGNIPEQEDTPTTAMQLVEDERFREECLRARKQAHDRLAHLHVTTPDESFNRWVNIWIQHQLAYCADWNRGWGKGFRDGMQDAWAFLLMDPRQVRGMIRDALPHQYPDGRTLRKWAPIDRKEYNDGPVWLALATAAYVAETGDTDFLTEEFAFFESDERGTALDHLLRGMRTLHDQRGKHGLCLMPYGDWNDGLTGPGKEGQGESIWTSLAFAAALPKVAELAEVAGDTDAASTCRSWRNELEQSLRQHAWNGRWFSRAFGDDAEPIGDPESKYGRIFLLPQAWAILSGIADEQQTDAILAACKEHLLVEHGYLLLAPGWNEYDPKIGHISGRRPGVVENGGNYCHGSAFMMAALCAAGRQDDALDLFGRLVPTNPANPPSRSRQEPFSITNTYRSPEAGASAGRAMFSWRTGCAGWMLRAAIEGILGMRAELGGLRVEGALPSNWDEATVSRRYRGKPLTVRFRRTGRPALTLDGQRLQTTVIPADLLTDDCSILCEV
jgi:cellobiose phosphorylase